MNKLTVILPTEAKLEESKKLGLISRWKFYFSELSKHFDIEVYSCDTKNFSNELNVKHNPLPFSFRLFPYGNQIFYNFYLLSRIRKMTKILRIISVSYFVLPLIKLFKKKIVLSYHYDYQTTTHRDFGGFKGYTAKFREYSSIIPADFIITTTDELQDKIQKRFKKKAVLIPNFVDISKFKPSKKDDYILFAGRVYWHKGIDYLIEAFIDIEKKYSIKLKIAGLGDLDYYKEKAKKLGIKNIEFLGSVDNSKMPELMGKAKVFILPSVNREGHPKALIESMACGCACIATDVPGNRDLIKDGENGLLIRPKDFEAIKTSVIKILENEELRVKLSNNAIKTAEKFSLENTLYKEIEFLENIVKESNANVLTSVAPF